MTKSKVGDKALVPVTLSELEKVGFGIKKEEVEE